MLPFLQPKKAASVIMAKMKPDGIEPMHEEGEEDPSLMMAAEDILSAISMKDAKALAEALKAANDIMNSEETGDEQ